MKESMEKWWKSRSAKDNYHSQLNTMRKKIEDARKTIADAKKSIEDLNATLSEQQQELRDAKYFNEIAKKYGDKERIQSTQTDIDKANKNINDTKSQIADKEKEIAEAQKGMFALQGYTQAAIENRAALKQLQSTMMEMIEAYAATGASNEQVAAHARQLAVGNILDSLLGRSSGAVVGDALLDRAGNVLDRGRQAVEPAGQLGDLTTVEAHRMTWPNPVKRSTSPMSSGTPRASC